MCYIYEEEKKFIIWLHTTTVHKTASLAGEGNLHPAGLAAHTH